MRRNWSTLARSENGARCAGTECGARVSAPLPRWIKYQAQRSQAQSACVPPKLVSACCPYLPQHSARSSFGRSLEKSSDLSEAPPISPPSISAIRKQSGSIVTFHAAAIQYSCLVPRFCQHRETRGKSRMCAVNLLRLLRCWPLHRFRLPIRARRQSTASSQSIWIPHRIKHGSLVVHQ